MSTVYVTTYEVVGSGLAVVADFYSRVEAAKAAHWTFAESVGGVGYRPNRSGGMRSVFFPGELPAGWRKTGAEGGKTEAVPRKGTTAGKALHNQLAAMPVMPQASDLAEQLGYAPSELAIDRHRGTIYFPSELRVKFPTQRAFVRLPRFSGDGFEPDASILVALPESDFMKAVEDHNAEARRQREAING